MQQALQITIPNEEPSHDEAEAVREAAHPYHGGGVWDALRGDERHGAPSALEGAVAASRIGLEEEGKEKERMDSHPRRTSRSMITAAPFMTRARVIAPCVQLMTRPTHGVDGSR